MNETSIDLSLIARLVRRRWVVMLILAVLGAGLGAVASAMFSPGYVSTAKVLLQGARNETEVPGEAEIATSQLVLDRVADELQWGVTGAQLVSRVSAEITDGNVLVITGSAATPASAQQLADRAMAGYTDFSTQIITDAANMNSATTQKARTAIQQKIDAANKRITEIQGSPAITAQTPEGDQARAEMQQQQKVVGDATQQLQQIDAAAETSALNETLKGANARVIQRATLPDNEAAPTLLQLVLGGAAALVLLGIFAHLIALRTDKRLRRVQDMADAFGAPVLGVVGAPAGPTAKAPFMRRLLKDDFSWATRDLPVVDDGRSHAARYNRLLRRLPKSPAPATILAVVPNDDPVAVTALVEFVVVAAAGPTRVVVVTADEALAERVVAEGESHGVSGNLSAGATEPEAGTALVVQVAAVAADQPTVFDSGATDGAALFVRVGSRTSWELAGISSACVDAGHPLVGVLAVFPTNATAEGKGDAAPVEATETTMAGTA